MYRKLFRTLPTLVTTAIVLAGAVTFAVVGWTQFTPQMYVDINNFPNFKETFRGQCTESEIRDAWAAKIDMYDDIKNHYGNGVCQLRGPYKPCYIMDSRNVKKAELLTTDEIKQVIQILKTHPAFQEAPLKWTSDWKYCEIRAAAAHKLFSENALIGNPPRKINFGKIFATGNLSYRPGAERYDYPYHTALFALGKDAKTGLVKIQVIDVPMANEGLDLDHWIGNLNKFSDPLPQVQLRDGCTMIPDRADEPGTYRCDMLKGAIDNPRLWQLLSTPPKSSVK